MEEKFDAIVIGAGASGLGAAYKLARYGFNVVVLERGQRVGAKNVYGGRIYSHVFEKEIPDFRKEAPVERWVKKERLTLMDENDAVTVELFSDFSPPNDSFTAILTKFNAWLAGKVEDAGGLVITGIKVDDLVMENGAVKGIVADDEKLIADVVIDAEGVNPLLARRAGLRGDWEPDHIAVGVKEVIKLPKEVIEDRFNLDDGEGVANLFLGYASSFAQGGGFLYTNLDTVSLGVVVRVDAAMARKIKIYDIVEDFRAHPYISRLLKGGNVIEYSAHLVPEAGIKGVAPKLYSDGLLLTGDAAGFVLNRGLTVRGVDFAFYSGVLAAETVKEAHEKGDFSASTLSEYERKLRESFVLGELEAFRRAPVVLSNLRFYETYPRVLVDIMKEAFTVDGNAKKLYPVMREKMKGRMSLFTLIRDTLAAVRNL